MRAHDDLKGEPAGTQGPRLADVLAHVAVIELVCAPRGLDVEVGDPVIYDAVSQETIEQAAIVLGVGVDTATGDAIDLVRRAAEAGAAALALKLSTAIATPASEALRAQAERSGIALLALPHEMAWSQAHHLLRTAVTSELEEAADDVPLGDLFALANAVAAMVGGPTTIEDRRSRVLAYSTQSAGIDEPRRQTILGRQVPDEWLKRLEDEGVFKRLWAGEVVRYRAGPGFDIRPRIAVAVRAGDVILGSIWVAEGDTPLGEGAEEALCEAARIAALHLLRHRASTDLERTLRGDLLLQLLDGRSSVDAVAHKLGVRSDATFAVLAFEPVSSDDVESALQRERALDLVALYGEAFRQRSALVQIGRTFYVLLPDPASKPQRLVELASDIVRRSSESLGVRLRAGVGSVVANLRDIRRSRDEADQVLRALASSSDLGDVADFDEARQHIVITELRDLLAERDHLRSEPLALLMQHDVDHATSYVDTLRCFLDAFGDIPAAAKSANVHANTFRYRLKRLGEICGLDISDPHARLLAEIDLRLR